VRALGFARAGRTRGGAPPATDSLRRPVRAADENIAHNSYESGVLEDPWAAPPDDMFVLTKDLTKAKADPEPLTISFTRGVPTRVRNDATGEVKTDPVDLMIMLNQLGQAHGVGRRDIVENRYVGVRFSLARCATTAAERRSGRFRRASRELTRGGGCRAQMKSRGVYEAPGHTILREAHLDIEGLTVDREVRKLRDVYSAKFAELVCVAVARREAGEAREVPRLTLRARAEQLCVGVARVAVPGASQPAARAKRLTLAPQTTGTGSRRSWPSSGTPSRSRRRT